MQTISYLYEIGVTSKAQFFIVPQEQVDNKRMTMLAFVGLLFLVTMSTTYADTAYKIMDSKVPTLTENSCPPICSTLMNLALKGISLAFSTIMQELYFDSGFCHCAITGLGHFTFNESCSSNAARDVFDHKITVFFNNPLTNCSCPLFNNPSATAENITNSNSPVGTCGKESVTDKLPKAIIKCDSDNESPAETGKLVELLVDLSNGILDMTYRVDTRQPQAVFPLSITFTAVDNPFSVKNADDFEKAFECINNPENKEAFFRKLFFPTYKRIFDCLDDRHEYSRSLIDGLLFYGGNCNNFPSLG